MCVHRQDRVRAENELEECYCGPGKFTGGLEQVLAWLRERRRLFCAPGSARLSPALGTIGPGRRAGDGTERPAPGGIHRPWARSTQRWPEPTPSSLCLLGPLFFWLSPTRRRAWFGASPSGVWRAWRGTGWPECPQGCSGT